MTSEERNSQVEAVLKGSFDLHVHAGPDPYQERRMDALDAGRHAQEAEMAGFVLKSHYYPTGALAHAVNRVYPGLSVAGAIVLNHEVGGLNPDAVDAAANIGAKVVWMPTRGVEADRPGRGVAPSLRVTDDKGGLLPQVHDVVDVVAKHDMALASGHISPEQAIALFAEAKAKGVRRMIATHPAAVATPQQLREMTSHGAYIEYTFASCMPSSNAMSPAELVSALRSVGVERCVVTTDFGQWMHPPPAEGIRMAIATLLEAGLGPEEVATLVKSNPRQLIGLDSP